LADTTHPIANLRAARRELLAALQGYSADDMLLPGHEGEWSIRDVLVHLAARLRELARMVPDLATQGYQRGEPCDPGPDWSVWNATEIAPYRSLRPEAALAGFATAHTRLLEAVSRLDDEALRRVGPTRFGRQCCGWQLLHDEAHHQREHAARIALPRERPLTLEDARCQDRPFALAAGS
jgi:uncharacterized protein (TIGR03083 family)